MYRFTQTPRQRRDAALVSLALVLAVAGVVNLRWWHHGFLSIPFAVQVLGVGFFVGLIVFGAYDQRHREVVATPEGLDTRRLWHSTFIPWTGLRDVELRRTWMGDHLVAITVTGPVTLDAPVLTVVRSRAARREFDETSAELQRVIARRAA